MDAHHHYMAAQNILDRERVVIQKEKVVQQLFANAERMKAELEAASMSLARREEELNMAKDCMERDRALFETMQAHIEMGNKNLEEISVLESQLQTERERTSGYERVITELDELTVELQSTNEKAAVLQNENDKLRSEALLACQEADTYRRKYEEECHNSEKLLKQLAEISVDVGKLQDSAGSYQIQQEAEIEKLKGERDGLKKKVEEEKTAKETAFGLLAENDMALRDFSAEHSAMKVQIQSLQDATKRIKTAHGRQRQTLDEMVSEITLLVQTIKHQQSDIHARGRAIRDKDATIQQQTAELTHLRSIVDVYKRHNPVVAPPYVTSSHSTSRADLHLSQGTRPRSSEAD
eukprot:TRINITY_DN19352_c0_g1_i2.p1 TRINITY_DN19352_c0_g1~~TRINITY_DN19352_c0_g1_i2.p1  ORF type:complete len:351 (+),score=84.95 TRINITY_DN19352_c0_g1_i2:76-1128(+)